MCCVIVWQMKSRALTFVFQGLNSLTFILLHCLVIICLLQIAVYCKICFLFMLLQAAKDDIQECFKSIVNVTELQAEMEIAKPTGDLDAVFRKYCR